VIVGGYMNFMKRRGEGWGKNGRPNPLPDFFIHKFVEANLCDIEPTKVTRTWINNHLREECISKRLDRFFVLDKIMEEVAGIKSWVVQGNLNLGLCKGQFKAPQQLSNSIQIIWIW
jgi:hypothetical protein